MSEIDRCALNVTIRYSRSGFFGWHRGEMRRGEMRPGCYTVSLEGFWDAGLETTIDGALNELVAKLREWVEGLEGDADYAWAQASERGQTSLLRAIEQLLVDGTLRATLGEVAALTEPVLDEADETRG